MGRLIYGGIGSLDGFIADATGDFGWSAPDEEVFAFLNAREERTSAELCGRRLYEVLAVWETFGTEANDTEVERRYGEMWRARDKVVFSSTLTEVTTANTRLESRFDPDEVRRFVAAQPGDVNIGGPTLAAGALRAGIVDVIEYYANPIIVGSGTTWLPGDLRLGLRLIGEHRFTNGVVHLAYEVERDDS